jgi:hypothetical protein
MQRNSLHRCLFFAFGLVALAGAWWQFPRGQGGAHAQTAGDCSLASLAGNYGFAEHGSVLLGPSVQPNPNSGPRLDFVDVGRSVFDGQGGVSITTDTRSTEGQVEQVTGNGAYMVNTDCTGSTSLSFSDGHTGHDAFVIVKGGKDLHIIGTDPGLLRAGTAHRQ